MAAKKETTALAVMDNFTIANRYDDLDPELLAEIQDELEDLDPENSFECRKITVPSGGVLTYVVQGEDENDTDTKKEITGVIVFTHRVSGYWPGAYGSSDNQSKVPVCSSMDGKTGLNTETGELRPCEGCPYNEYGTAVDQQGNRSKGKACKNMRRLYLMMNGDPNLYQLTAPPTSVKDVDKQLKRILPYKKKIVSLTLNKAQNSNGVSFGKISIKQIGVLPPAAAATSEALHNQLKSTYKEMTPVTMDDYGTQTSVQKGRPVDLYPSDAETAAMDNYDPPFEEAPPHDDGDAPLPF